MTCRMKSYSSYPNQFVIHLVCFFLYARHIIIIIIISLQHGEDGDRKPKGQRWVLALNIVDWFDYYYCCCVVCLGNITGCCCFPPVSFFWYICAMNHDTWFVINHSQRSVSVASALEGRERSSAPTLRTRHH